MMAISFAIGEILEKFSRFFIDLLFSLNFFIFPFFSLKEKKYLSDVEETMPMLHFFPIAFNIELKT